MRLLISTLILGMSAQALANETNQEVALQIQKDLSYAASLQGLTPEGEACSVEISFEEGFSVVTARNNVSTLHFDGYGVYLKKTKRASHLDTITCDGHEEAAISEQFAQSKIVVQVTEEFRGVETTIACILPKK